MTKPFNVMSIVAVVVSWDLLPLSLYAQGAGAAVGNGVGSLGTFTNPVLESGPDPWVTSRDGFYYYIRSGRDGLVILKTRSVADLKSAERKVVWKPPASGPYSHEIWAPELHFLRGKWYIYFAGDAGSNQSHRMWALENPSSDPLQGEWVMKGKVSDPTDKYAIDGTVFENRGRLYFVWSGLEGDANGVQILYIAELKNPWAVKGRRVRISTPEFPWEKIGDRSPTDGAPGSVKRNPEDNPGSNTVTWEPMHNDVNEGPSVLQHDDKIFVVYSASGCWTDYYELGMLTASASSNLLNPASWKKSPLPVFWQSPEAHAYGPGHNSFFKSPDGKEDWILYHANPEPHQGCGSRRSPRAQPFTWKPDGTPDFGRPVPIGKPIPRPSGE